MMPRLSFAEPVTRASCTRQRMSLIAPEAVDRFLATYSPLGLMAHALGTQAKHVSARLDKAEVWPIPRAGPLRPDQSALRSVRWTTALPPDQPPL